MNTTKSCKLPYMQPDCKIVLHLNTHILYLINTYILHLTSVKIKIQITLRTALYAFRVFFYARSLHPRYKHIVAHKYSGFVP